MNRAQISGRLTKDVELTYTSSQMAVAKFTVAVDRGKDKNGEDRGADYIPVTVFGRQAENTEKFVAKGNRILIEGHIQTGSYDKDGEKRFTTDVIADRVEFIDFKGKVAENGNESLTGVSKPQQTTPPKQSEPVQEEFSPFGFEAITEDLPF